jgi:hypothetical protein
VDNDPIQEERGRIARSYDAVAELFASRGETFEDEDAQKLEEGDAPKKPSFPFMIVMVSVLKDILDWPLDLTVVLAIAAFCLSIFLGLILAFWTMGKISGGWWKKSLIRWLWLRFFIMLGIELIPFVNLAPANTIFVLMAHYKETKIVKLFDEALEILHRGGAGKAGVTVSDAFQTGLQRRREEWEDSATGREEARRTRTAASERVASMRTLRERQIGRGSRPAGVQPSASDTRASEQGREAA